MVYANGDVLLAGSVQLFWQLVGSAYLTTNANTTVVSSPIDGSNYNTFLVQLNARMGSRGVPDVTSLLINNTAATRSDYYQTKNGAAFTFGGGTTADVDVNAAGSGLLNVTTIINQYGTQQIMADGKSSWADTVSTFQNRMQTWYATWAGLGIISGMHFTSANVKFNSGTQLYVYGMKNIT